MTDVPPRPTAAPQGRHGALPAVAVLLLALAAQAGVLRNEACLDDVPVVVERVPPLAGVQSAARALRRPDWPGDQEWQPFRPLALASLALERPRAAAGPRENDVTGAHVVNLALHALAALLLLSLVRTLAPGRPLLAFGAAALLATHPLATGAITLATGRSVLLGTVCALAALRLLRAYGPGRAALLPLIALFTFLSLLACEAFVALPLVAAAWDLAAARAAGAGAGRARAPAYGALALAALLWLPLWPGPGWPALHVPAPSGALERLALGAEALARDAIKLVAPVGLTPDRSDEARAGQGFVLEQERLAATVAGGALLLLLALRRARGRGGSAAAGLLTAGGLLLGAALTLPHGAVLEDRWAYLALPGLALLGGRALEELLRGRTPFALGLAGAFVLGAALGVLSHVEAGRFRDDAAVHERLLAGPGGHGPARLRQAERQVREVQRDTERLLLQSSVSPGYAEAAESIRARRAAATAILKRHVLEPATRDDARGWLLLGELELQGETPLDAFERFAEARRLDPLLAASGDPPPALRADPRALHQAARILAATGQVETLRARSGPAAAAYRQAVAFEDEAARLAGRAPTPLLMFRGALALLNDGLYAEAIPLLERLALESPDPHLREEARLQAGKSRIESAQQRDDLVARGRAAMETEHWRTAAEAYEGALRIDPDHAESRWWAAWIRGRHFGAYEIGLGYVQVGLARLAQRAPGPEVEDQRAKLEQLRADLERRRAEDEARTTEEERGGR